MNYSGIVKCTQILLIKSVKKRTCVDLNLRFDVYLQIAREGLMATLGDPLTREPPRVARGPLN